MRKLIRHLLLLAVVILTACTNELPYTQIESQPKLIMNAQINAEGEAQELLLHLTGRDRATPLRQGATLTISVNGQLRNTLRPDTNTSSQSDTKFVFDADFKSGDVVRFEARTDDGVYQAWAEVTVPAIPQAASHFSEQRVASLNNYNFATSRYRFTVHDDPSQHNYYRLTAGYIKAFYNANADPATMADEPFIEVYRTSNYSYNSSEDMVLSDGLPVPRQNESEDINLIGVVNVTGAFDDTYFDGNSYTMSIYQERKSYGYYEEVDSTAEYAEIGIEAISKDYYDYLRALNIYRSDSYSEEVSQPIVFPSNVQGGTGLVTIFKRKEVCFPLQRY